MWNEKNSSHLIVETVAELEKHRLMTKKNLFDYIVKGLDGNSEFLSKVSQVEPDPFYADEVHHVSNFIIDVIVEAKDHTLFKNDIKSSKVKFKENLLKAVDINKLTKENFERTIKEKELFIFKDFVIYQHLKTVESILKESNLITEYISK